MKYVPASVACIVMLTFVTACGGEESATPSSSSPSASPTAASSSPTVPYDPSTESDAGGVVVPGGEGDMSPAEVAATDPAGYRWIDGMTVQVVSAAIGTRETQEPGMVSVTLVERVTNNGSAPISFNTGGTLYFKMSLTYGQNYTDAQGYFEDGGPEDALPGRLVPGTSVDVNGYYEVPADEATDLRLTVNPDTDNYIDAVITGIEQLAV